MEKGKLFVIEGSGDGIGKSTQCALLIERLREAGNQIIIHHFPSYTTKQGALVEMYLRGEFGEIENLSPIL